MKAAQNTEPSPLDQIKEANYRMKKKHERATGLGILWLFVCFVCAVLWGLFEIKIHGGTGNMFLQMLMVAAITLVVFILGQRLIRWKMNLSKEYQHLISQAHILLEKGSLRRRDESEVLFFLSWCYN